MHSQPPSTLTALHVPLHGYDWKPSTLSALCLALSCWQRWGPSPGRANLTQRFTGPHPRWGRAISGKERWEQHRTSAGQRGHRKALPGSLRAWRQCRAELSSCTRAFRLGSSPLTTGTLLLPSELFPPNQSKLRQHSVRCQSIPLVPAAQGFQQDFPPQVSLGGTSLNPRCGCGIARLCVARVPGKE